VINHIASNTTNIAITNINIVKLLFQLLEWEDDRAISMLFSALGALRKSFTEMKYGSLYLLYKKFLFINT
jgi:hypothetical protein